MAASFIVNEVRRGQYLDSVALMRMSRTVAAMDGVIECGMMMGTPANMRIMADAGVLADNGRGAAPGDLVIAISANTQSATDVALTAARALLDAPKAGAGKAADWSPRTIRAAIAADPAARLALISVPGAFAAAEGRKALARGLNVLMFSDNVPIEDEVALKQFARERGLLMMGPDCGTAIISGTALGFANVVPRGDIGIVGASGTGIQEVSCLIANNGGGISHAIGTGGRDLKKEVGGVTMLMGIDMLDRDEGTRHIVVISKPPAAEVAQRVIERIGKSKKTFTVCFLGANDAGLPPNATLAPTLELAAAHAGNSKCRPHTLLPKRGRPGKLVRGLFAGGTMCAEAQVIFRNQGVACASNAPNPGTAPYLPGYAGHTLLDLGDDEYTAGRPHPMIEPAVRDAPIAAALADPATGVVLIDFVLGYGAHADPAGHLVTALGTLPNNGAVIVASVTGTEADPQRRSAQIATLERGGIVIAPSNAAAASLALSIVGSE